MPNYIDQKVVQMEFDNSRFEKGVEQSLKTLEALKKGLELDKSANSLSNLEKIANEVDFSGLTKNIDSIADHFTLIGRFIDRHIDVMVDKMVNGTKAFVKSITVDQISKGQFKYEQYNKAVQMIKSALPDEKMETIETALERLNEYTDLTSYDFATMAKTIGKFTSKGMGLVESELAMEGIANWSAAAGTDIAQANIAMYNLSQALGAGAMKLMDWRSIQTANMDTKEFKEQAIQAAIALGVLGKGVGNTGILIKQTKKGVEQITVDYQNFEQTLKEGWFNKDVIMSVLTEYADRESEVGKKGFKAAREAITLTQAIDAVKDAVSTGWMHSFGYIFGDLDEATKLFTNASDGLIDFLATYSEARNELLAGWHGDGVDDPMSGYAMAIDALSTAWENFLIIVEDVQNIVGEIFPPVTSQNLIDMTENIRNFTKDINEFLTGHTEEKVIRTKIKTDGIEEWTDFIQLGSEGEDVKRLQKRLMDLGFDLGKTGADGIFGPKTQEALMDFQAKLGLVQDGVYKIEERDGLAKALFPNGVTEFKETTETTVTLSSALENIQKVIRGVFSIVSIGGQVVGFVINLVKTGLYILAPLGSAILSVLGVIGDCFTTLDQGLKILDPFNTAIAILQSFIGNQLADFFDGLGNAVSFFLGAVGEAPSFLGVLIALFETIEQTKFGQYIKGIWDVVSSVFGLASGSISGFLKDIQGAIKIINNAFDMMFQAPEGRFNSFWSVWKHFEKVFLISSNKITGSIGGFMYHARIGLQQVIPKIKEFGANAKVFLGKAFTTALTVAGVAIGAIVSGAIALGKAIWNTGKAVVNFVKTNETLQSIFANIRSVGERVIGFFGDLGKAISSGFGIAKEKKIKGFGDILARVFYGMRNSKNTVIQQLGTGLRNFITGLGFVINKVKEFGATAGKWLGKAFSTVLKVGALAVTALVAGIIWLGKTLWNAGKAVVTFVKNNKILEDIFNRIGSAAKSVWGFISEFGKSIGSVFTNKSSKKILNFGEIWNKVSRNFRLSKNKHLQALGKFMRDLSRWFKKAGETVKEFGGKVKDWLGGKFTAAITWITENVPKAWDTIKNFFINAYNNVKGSNVIQNAFQSIKDKISKIFPGIKQTLSDIGGAIHDFFFGKKTNEEPKTLKERFEDLKNTIKKFVVDANEKIAELYEKSTVFRFVVKNLRNAFKWLKGFFIQLKDSFIDFFTMDTSDKDSPIEKLKKRLSAFQPFIDKFLNLKDKLIKGWKDLLGISGDKKKFSLKDSFESLLGGLSNFFSRFKGFNFRKILGIAIKALGAYAVIKLFTFSRNLSGALKKFSQSLFLKSGGKIDTIGDTFLKIAASVSLIALALGLLATQNLENVKTAMKLVLITFGVVATIGALANKVGGKGIGNTTLSIAGSVLGIAIGLGILCKVLEKYPLGSKTMNDALIVIAGSLVLLGAISLAISRWGGDNSGAGIASILGLCAGVDLLVIGLWGVTALIDKYGGNDVAGAWGIIEALLVTVGGVTIAINKLGGGAKQSLANAIEIISLVAGVKSLVLDIAVVTVLIDKYGSDAVGAWGMIEGIMATIAIAIAAINSTATNAGTSLAGAVEIASIGWAVGRIADKMSAGIEKIKGVDTDKIVAFFGGIDSILLAAGASIKLLSSIDIGTQLLGDLGLVGFAAALGLAIDAFATFGSDALEKFGTATWIVGSKLKNFSLLMKQVDYDVVLNQGIPLINTLIDLMKDTLTQIDSGLIGQVDDVGSCIVRFGNSINMFNNSVNGSNTEKIDAVKTIADTTVGLVTDVDSKIDSDMLNRVTRVFTRIGSALRLYYNNLATINFDNGGATPEQIKQAFTGLSEGLPDDSLIGDIASYADTGSGSNLEDFALGLTALGGAIETYGNEIGKLNIFKIAVANSVLSTVSNLKSSLDTNSKFLGLVDIVPDKKDSLEKFSEDVNLLGTAIGHYGDMSNGLDSDKIALANGIVEEVAKLDLPTTGGFWQVITGSKSLGGFASNLGSLGDGVGQFVSAIKDTGYESIDMYRALYPIRVLGEVASKLPETGGAISLLTGDTSLGGLANSLVEYGGKINEFVSEMSGFNKNDPHLRDAIDVLTEIVELQVQIQSGSVNAFYDLGTGIERLFNVLAGVTENTNKKGEYDSILSDAENAAWGLEGIVYDHLESIKTTINTAFNAIKTYIEYYKLVYTSQTVLAMNSISSAIDSKKSKVLNSAASVLTNLVKLGRLYQNDFINIGYQLDYGLAQGIRDRAYHPQGAFARVVRQAYEAGMAAAQIRSPSRVTAWMGEMMDQGLANGLMAYSNRVDNASSDVVQSAIDTAEMGLSTLASIIASDVDTTPVIRPVLDMTDIESGASAIGGMFGNQSIGVRSAGMAYRVASIDNARIYDTGKTDVSSSNLGATIDNLNAKIDELGQRISTMQVVMDNGALVGQMSAGMDHALGVRRMRARRGGV